MLLTLLLSAAPSTDCVALDGPASSPLLGRLREELAVTVGRPVVGAGTACDTTLTLSDDARRLRIEARGATPPVLLDEPAGPGSLATIAAHLAEVVRGALLEVEVRAQAPPAAPPAPARIDDVPLPPPPPPEQVRRLEARVGVGVVSLTGGLGPAPGVEGSVGWRFSQRVGASLTVAGAPLPAMRVVAEGRLLASPVAAWGLLATHLPIGSAVELALGVGGGAALFALEGRAEAPFVGGRATGVSALALVDLSLKVRLVGALSVWLAGAGMALLQRLTLTVTGGPVASLGPLLFWPRAGVELAW